MIRAAIIGLGWWGRTLVESVQGQSQAIRFTVGATRTRTGEVEAFAEEQGLVLQDSLEAVLDNPDVDAAVLATPHSMHARQVVAAAEAGRHVFCEKPFTLTRADAEAAVAATQKAGVTLGLGYNRRFHPTMRAVRDQVTSGALGTILHVEGTMSFPNALALSADHWRADRNETPCGGLMPMGVHIIDSLIDMCGPVEEVFCTSSRRAVSIEADDTTAVIFRMKQGSSAYLGTMTATGGSYRYQVFGSEGWVRLDGMSHVAGASSLERRSRLFASCVFQPVKGAQESRTVEAYDVSRAALDAFADACQGGPAYPIPLEEMIHGAAVTEAIVRSAGSGRMEKVG